MPVEIEHGYSAFKQDPCIQHDPRGENPVRAFRCWRLTKKMEDYRKKCECEFESLIEKYKEFSDTPEFEAELEFIEKYTRSGAGATHGLAMLACMAVKARADGEDKLVTKWIKVCGLQIPFRRMPK